MRAHAHLFSPRPPLASNTCRYVKNLKRALLSGAATRIEAILLTHSHHDHIGGLKDVKNAFGARIPVYMLRTPGKELPEGITEMTDGQVFETIGATVRVVATPGHTDDHASFFVEEEGALFTGDSVLGEGATTFEDLDMYLGSLQKMLDIPHARTIYPGHGPPVRDVRGRLNAYISALAVRESAILNRLKRERDVKGRKGISTIRIVYKLYGDKDMLTQLAGAQVVIAHLKKLYDMGVVDFKPQRFIFPDKWTLKGDVDQGLFAKAQVQSGAPKAFGMSVADFNDAFGDAKGAGEAGSSPKYQPPASSASSSSSPGSTPVHSDASDGGSDAGSESTSTSTTSSMSTSTAST